MPMIMGASPQAGLAMVGDPEVDWGFQGTDSGFPTSQSQERLFTAALRAGSHSDGATRILRILVPAINQITRDLN